jgi:hypothetical protein
MTTARAAGLTAMTAGVTALTAGLTTLTAGLTTLTAGSAAPLTTGLLTAGLGVALLEGGGPQPALEGILVAPPRDDEVAVETLGRAEELEGLEAVDLLDLTGPGREPLLEDLAPALGNLEHVDLDDGHPLHLRSVGPRA